MFTGEQGTLRLDRWLAASLVVLVEHGGHGGSAAGPIAAKIYQWLYYHGYFKHHPLEEVQKELAKKREDLNATQSPNTQAPKLRMDQTRIGN